MNRTRTILFFVAILGFIGIAIFGFFTHESLYIILGVVPAAFFSVAGLGFLLLWGFRLLNTKVQAILLGAVFLLLLVVLFIQPEISIFIGFCLLLLPLIVAVMQLTGIGFTVGTPTPLQEAQRKRELAKQSDSVFEGGCCLFLAASPVAGIILLVLGWLFQREAFNGFLGLFR